MCFYKNIIIIEDGKDSIELFISALPDICKKSIVQGFETASEFQKFTKDNNWLPDLIFIEINLREYNGFEVLKMFKDDILFNQIPVIVYSNSRELKEIEMLHSLGASGYFVKPHTFSEFAAILRYIINESPVNITLREKANFIITSKI